MTIDFVELSAHLAEYLARVRAGETIFIEDQNHVLAKIMPVSDAADIEREEMADLVRRGVARALVEPLTAEDVSVLLSPLLHGEPGPDVVAAILAERESGR